MNTIRANKLTALVPSVEKAGWSTKQWVLRIMDEGTSAP